MRLRSSSSAFLFATLAISSSSSSLAAPTGESIPSEGIPSSSSTRDLSSVSIPNGFSRRDIVPASLPTNPIDPNTMLELLEGLNDQDRATIRKGLEGNVAALALFDTIVAALPPTPASPEDALHRIMQMTGIDETLDESQMSFAAPDSESGSEYSQSDSESEEHTSTDIPSPASTDFSTPASTSSHAAPTSTDLASPSDAERRGLLGDVIGGLPIVGPILVPILAPLLRPLEQILAGLGIGAESVSPTALAMLSALSPEHVDAMQVAAASKSADSAVARRRSFSRRGPIEDLLNALLANPLVGGLLKTLLATLGLDVHQASSATVAMLSVLSPEDLNTIHDSAVSTAAAAGDSSSPSSIETVSELPRKTTKPSSTDAASSTVSSEATKPTQFQRRSQNPRDYQIRQPRAMFYPREEAAQESSSSSVEPSSAGPSSVEPLSSVKAVQPTLAPPNTPTVPVNNPIDAVPVASVPVAQAGSVTDSVPVAHVIPVGAVPAGAVPVGAVPVGVVPVGAVPVDVPGTVGGAAPVPVPV